GKLHVPHCPACPKVECQATIQAPQAACVSRESIQYEYVLVPSPKKGCPAVSVPVPQITTEHSGEGSAGEAGVRASVEASPSNGGGVPGNVPGGLFARPDWRLGALGGVGKSGLEGGGIVERRILGPIDIGIYARVPVRDPSYASVGVTIGGSWCVSACSQVAC